MARDYAGMFFAGLKRRRKKVELLGGMGENLPTGAKAHEDFTVNMRGLKPPPPSGIKYPLGTSEVVP